jgi:hypothetical protein
LDGPPVGFGHFTHGLVFIENRPGALVEIGELPVLVRPMQGQCSSGKKDTGENEANQNVLAPIH